MFPKSPHIILTRYNTDRYKKTHYTESVQLENIEGLSEPIISVCLWANGRQMEGQGDDEKWANYTTSLTDYLAGEYVLHDLLVL